MEANTLSQPGSNTIPFAQLGLQSPGLLQNIEALGFANATPIQSAVIPLALERKDVSGLSRTGTGKTCAFLIPTIDRLLGMPKESYALCLTPTRELAIQIEVEANKLCRNLPLRPVSLVGGMPINDQIREIRGGARLIIGTPGRVMDLMRSRMLNPEQVEILVFDEADRMFDMGFIDDMRFILQRVHPERQILLFSATMNFTVLTMMYEFRSNPVEVNISKDQLTADGIEQIIYHVGEQEKPAYLVKFCKEVESGGIIVFVNFREKVHWVADLLSANGIAATGISSLLRQDKRNKILQGFRAGKFRALVATDVASRGLDIDGVALVVNYQLPDETANYVHRIGRTARAGRSGRAVSIAGPDDGYNQLKIEEFIGNKIPVGWLNTEDIEFNINLPGKSRNTDRMHQDTQDEIDNRSEVSDDKDIENHRNSSRPPRPQDGPRRQDSERQDFTRGDRHDRGDRGGQRHQRNKNQAAPGLPADAPARRQDSRRNEGRSSEQRRNQHGHRSSEQRRAHPGERYSVKVNPRREQNPGSSPIEASGESRTRTSNLVTGSPVIYCTLTGKVKVNPVNLPEGGVAAAPENSSRRSSIFRKIGSTVTSIFSKK